MLTTTPWLYLPPASYLLEQAGLGVAWGNKTWEMQFH